MLGEEQGRSIAKDLKQAGEVGANSFNCLLDFAHSYLKYLTAEEKLLSGEALTSLNVWLFLDGQSGSTTRIKKRFRFSLP